MKRFLLLLPLFFLSAIIASAQSTPDSTLILVRDYVRQVQHDWQIPGLSLSIVKDDSLIFAEGFGVREKGRTVAKDGEKVAITENTIFHIGSISKSFTAAIMASVVDDGLVSWDDPVKKIMPDFDWWDNDVEKTLRVKDLFTHSTGLVAQVGTYIPNLGYDREDIYQMLHYMQPWYQVGERFAYNNITFIIAARIIEKVTGKSWEDNVRERIFTPLGMTSSSLGEEGYLAAGKNGSVAHDFRYVPTKDGRGRMGVTPLYGEERALHWVDVIGPAGGVISTAADMSKWVKFHLDMGKVASPSTSSETHSTSASSPTSDSKPVEGLHPRDSIQVISRKNMEFLHTGSTFVRQDTTSVRHYGYCWYVENNDRYDLIYHTGTTWGFTAICGFVPELRLGFALLCNSEVSEYARFAIMRRIIDLYLVKRDREAYTSLLARHTSSIQTEDSASVSIPDSVPELVEGVALSGYQTAMTDAIAAMFPEAKSFLDSLCRIQASSPSSARRHSSSTDEAATSAESYDSGNTLFAEVSPCPEWPSYNSLYDWNSHFLAKWYVDKKKPSSRKVPCTIKRSKEAPDFARLTGTYHKQAPFGDAKVTMENGKLYLTIGPKGWKHQLKHKSGNEFWMSSGGHTYPVFFHNYSPTSTASTDFEIDFNYNENFGPWKK